MKKKVMAIALTLALAFALSACGNDSIPLAKGVSKNDQKIQNISIERIHKHNPDNIPNQHGPK